jgi:type I restriction enzyme M protein
MLTGEQRSQIDRIWNAFWTGGISNPLTVIEQITYLLFIKRLDDIQLAKEQKAIHTGNVIESPVYQPGQETLRWSRFRHLDPEELFALFVKPDGVFAFMRSLGIIEGTAYNRFMKGATFMIPTPRLLTQVVDLLSDVQMDDRDTKGDIYEYLLSKIATAGQNGQFRTPRHIIKLMVDMMRPTPNDVVCDPSSGSCGFLVGAAEYMQHHYADEFFKPEFRQRFNGETSHETMFLGMEFDATMIRIGAMNLMLHGIEHPNLIDVDALSEANLGFTDRATLVLANPPFKGSLDHEAVERRILQTVNTKKTELLFLALMLRGLKVGGRAAVIVPDGVLFGSSKAHQQIRQVLIDRHQLQGVVSMPGGVFKPYAGVSTAILIFTKTNAGGTGDVWFYDMRADGFTLDDKRQPTAANDIPDIVTRWHSRAPSETSRSRTEQSFMVPVADIRANNYDLSINRYKEVVYAQQQHDTPADLIAKIETLDRERQADLQGLKALLGQSVTVTDQQS